MLRKLFVFLALLFVTPVLAQDAPLGYLSSTAVEGSHIFKTASGQWYSFNCNTGAASGWILAYDSATVPADGATVPFKWWQVAANTTVDRYYIHPVLFTNGLVLVFSTTGPFTKTISNTAVCSAETR